MHAQIHGRICTHTTYIQKKSFFSLSVERITNCDIFFMHLLKQWKSRGIADCFRGSLQVRIFRLIPCLVQRGNCPLSVGFEACSTGRNSYLRSPWSHVCKVRLLLSSMLSNCPLSVHISAYGQCCSQPWPQKLLPHWEACTTFRG